MVDELDHRAVGVADVAEHRVVLGTRDRLRVTDLQVLEMLQEPVPLLDLDREVVGRHAVHLLDRREVQVELAAGHQQHLGVTEAAHVLVLHPEDLRVPLLGALGIGGREVHVMNRVRLRLAH